MMVGEAAMVCIAATLHIEMASAIIVTVMTIEMKTGHHIAPPTHLVTATVVVEARMRGITADTTTAIATTITTTQLKKGVSEVTPTRQMMPSPPAGMKKERSRRQQKSRQNWKKQAKRRKGGIKTRNMGNMA
mmetsp:Transcript_795/g.1435  ORF Transcript_795/g.1435 Transcript_795/m.1435 type:complete len:132 (-) Transcript_795:1521-1916(-)